MLYKTVNKVLEIGRSEGTTPAKRLKAIVSVMDGEKIPKNTFAKFFSKEQLLPDEIAKLLGRGMILNLLLWIRLQSKHTL